jgi:4-diphosphocytidyl-2-C-methyl-D-erythritol kinase
MGDHLLPLRGALALPAVLIRPAIDVPANKTAAVYRALRAGSVAGPLPSLTEPADIASALSAQGNDLQAAAMAVMPPIAEALDALLACRGATQARLSGAGPTLFALFATQQQAGAAARQLAAQRPRDWIVTTILR